MGAPVEMLGKRFGRLVVVERGPDHVGPCLSRTRRWVCRCDCGQTVLTYGGGLRNGHVKSCGCLHKEIVAKKVLKHGKSETPEYNVWQGMRERCRNQNHESFVRYGGRGIRVCARWNDFALFLADMGPRPSPTHSIERRDNNGHYEPGNCYWATQQEQNRNKRNTVLVTFEGKTMTLSEWGRELGASPSVLSQRWKKFSTLRPVGRNHQRATNERHHQA